MKKEAIALIIAGLAYSIMSFAYMHNTFPSKDIFKMVVTKLDNIDRKLDNLISRDK